MLGQIGARDVVADTVGAVGLELRHPRIGWPAGDAHGIEDGDTGEVDGALDGLILRELEGRVDRAVADTTH